MQRNISMGKEGDKVQVKGTENIFSKIRKLPKSRKRHANIDLEKGKQDQKIKSTGYILAETICNNDNVLKAARDHDTTKGESTGRIADFSVEALKLQEIKMIYLKQ